MPGEGVGRLVSFAGPRPSIGYSFSRMDDFAATVAFAVAAADDDNADDVRAALALVFLEVVEAVAAAAAAAAAAALVVVVGKRAEEDEDEEEGEGVAETGAGVRAEDVVPPPLSPTPDVASAVFAFDFDLDIFDDFVISLAAFVETLGCCCNADKEEAGEDDEDAEGCGLDSGTLPFSPPTPLPTLPPALIPWPTPPDVGLGTRRNSPAPGAPSVKSRLLLRPLLLVWRPVLLLPMRALIV